MLTDTKDIEYAKIKAPLVSVVTPFFNTEEYLSECIESVLNQSYRNWEYILVNNKSTDRSLKIARSYAEREPRIQLFENEVFLTQMQNYNRALKMISAQSRYCKIVQADDWIFPNCLIEMVAVAETNPSVGIVGAYRLDDKKVNCDGLPYSSKVVSGKSICRLHLLEGLFVYGSPTSIMIRSDIIRNRVPFYNESSYHADTEACVEILQNCDFAFVHQVLTFTRRENESISTLIRKLDPNYLLDFLIILLKYGRKYLNKDEYEECLKNTEAKYYRYIGKSHWSGDKEKMLEYHKKGLENIGYQLDQHLLRKYAFLEIVDYILDLKKVGRRIFNILAKK